MDRPFVQIRTGGGYTYVGLTLDRYGILSAVVKYGPHIYHFEVAQSDGCFTERVFEDEVFGAGTFSAPGFH